MRTRAYVRDSKNEVRVLLVRAREQLDAIIMDMPDPSPYAPVDALTQLKNPKEML